MTDEDLPPEARVAIGYAGKADRDAFASLLTLDRQLARAVAGASEPIVGQLRLAWWRDALSVDPGSRPSGNPLLDTLVTAFAGFAPDLSQLVDGWEAVLLAETLDEQAIGALRRGREEGWIALAKAIGAPDGHDAIRPAAAQWALADLAAGLSDAEERGAVVRRAREAPHMESPLSRNLRPLNVLHSLARRALAAGGVPLLSDRTSALVALRSGLFGR